MKEHGPAAFTLPEFAVESPDIWGTLETNSSPPSSSSSSTSGDENGSEAETKTVANAGANANANANAENRPVVVIPIESERGRYQDLYLNLFDTIRNGAEPAIRWEEAELTMLITELAIQSSKQGRTILVPSASENVVPTASPVRECMSISRKLGRTLLRGSFNRKASSAVA